MDADEQLEGFIDKFTPDVAALARTLLKKIKARLPGATILVYDNYNALAIGFGPTEKARQAVLSLAVMPTWVLLYFLQGARLHDPHGLLRGAGSQGRHVRLVDADAFDDDRIEDLIVEALSLAEPPFDADRPPRLVIKSISARQRPRRPQPA